MTEAETVPGDVRKLAARFAAWHSANKISTLIESAIMADRASRPTIPLPDTGVSGELIDRLREIENHDWRVSFLAHTSDTAKEAADALARRSRDPGVEGLVEALEELQSFVGVMVGVGPDAVIPDTVPTPLGIPVKIGAIMAAATEALTTYREGQK